MLSIISLLGQLGGLIDALASFLPKLISFCAVIAAFIPPQTNPTGMKLYNIINAVAFNFNYAKNANNK